MTVSNLLQIDKKSFSVVSLKDESDEKAYWLAKTPQERLEALELMRQIVYNYDPAATRLQRVFTITQPQFPLLKIELF
ncbi:MAG TPA: hypothetical protein EYH05_01945 [Anaerolineae bacterium]|nr:hypothetical protein [Anaerolineae bacterium]